MRKRVKISEGKLKKKIGSEQICFLMINSPSAMYMILISKEEL